MTWREIDRVRELVKATEGAAPRCLTPVSVTAPSITASYRTNVGV